LGTGCIDTKAARSHLAGILSLVCARAALKAGAVDSALNMVNLAIDVLNAARYRDQPRIAAYRALAREAEARWRMAVENLAADLQASCKTKSPIFGPSLPPSFGPWE